MDDDGHGPHAAAPFSSLCPRCGAAFTCGMEAGLPECWCATLPVLGTIPDATAGCFCPACLRRALVAPGAPAAAGDA
jgi:hypothetical protein